jgi:hypothetical protein
MEWEQQLRNAYTFLSETFKEDLSEDYSNIKIDFQETEREDDIGYNCSRTGFSIRL